MRAIAKSRINLWADKHSAAKGDLLAFQSLAVKAEWDSFSAVRADLPSADLVGGDRLIVNIRGNSYRLICLIDFEQHGLLYRWFGTHAEYSKLSKEQVISI